jgi:hypothetical protein
LAIFCSHSRTGWNATATIAVATIERARFGWPPLPIRVPMPTTMPT